jgi:hypothetical protein
LFGSQARHEAGEGVAVRLILVFSATRSATSGMGRRKFLVRLSLTRHTVRIPKLDVRSSNLLARSDINPFAESFYAYLLMVGSAAQSP